MSKHPFSDLLIMATELTASKLQKQVAAHFLEAVAQSKLQSAIQGQLQPDRLILGIASYATQDLMMLDAINERQGTESVRIGNIPVFVFDVLSCSTMSDFERFIPGIGNVFQTPVLGYWQNGIAQRHLSGCEARAFLKDAFGLGDVCP